MGSKQQNKRSTEEIRTPSTKRRIGERDGTIPTKDQATTVYDWEAKKFNRVGAGSISA
jgi:hypothetical protein